MLAFHPIVQLFAILLNLYVFYLGVHRFRSLHLKKRTAFQWKRHVVLGEVALTTLLVGMAGGVTLVYVYWHGVLITGTHGKVALAMVPFVAFGLASGLYMNVKKKQRRVLPLLHGVNNLIVLFLSLMQVYSGFWVYKTFVLGE
jgi:hypothetical protein